MPLSIASHVIKMNYGAAIGKCAILNLSAFSRFIHFQNRQSLRAPTFLRPLQGPHMVLR